jgi:hypothetical protein
MQDCGCITHAHVVLSSTCACSAGAPAFLSGAYGAGEHLYWHAPIVQVPALCHEPVVHCAVIVKVLWMMLWMINVL